MHSAVATPDGEEHDLDLREQLLVEVKSPKVHVSLSAVKVAPKADIAISGSQLASGTYLVRK